MTQAEGEPKPSGIQVTIEKPDLIFRAMKRDKVGELASAMLTEPLGIVIVDFLSTKREFHLRGVINVPGLEKYTTQSAKETIAKKYGEVTKRGDHFVLTTAEGIKFILSEYEKLDIDASRKSNQPVSRRQIVLSTGIVEAELDQQVQIISAPHLDEHAFQGVLHAFAATLGDIAESLRQTKNVYHHPLPTEEIVISPPKKFPGQIDRQTGLEPISLDDLRERIEIEKPEVSFEDVGGQGEAKRELQQLGFAIKSPDLYERWGTKPPKGIILDGPSGVGKTLLAKALACEASATFYHVQAPDISSMWYGQSEKFLQGVFDLASDEQGPTIIFIDEIDTIAPKRDDAHEATQRVIGTLLENMDGLESSKNITVIASTNRFDSVEPALTRAGRFDRRITLKNPDQLGHEQILNIKARQAEEMAQRKLFENVDFDQVAFRATSNNFNGADDAEIIRRTLEEKVRLEGLGQEVTLVSTQDIIDEIVRYERVK